MRISLWVSPAAFITAGLIMVAWLIFECAKPASSQGACEITAHLFNSNMELANCRINLRN
jgi:hypothetical protein